LVGEPEGKGPLWKPRLRWENKIKMDLQEVGWGAVEWTGVAQTGTSGTPVETVINHRIPLREGNFLTSWGSISFFKKECCLDLVTLLYIRWHVCWKIFPNLCLSLSEVSVFLLRFSPKKTSTSRSQKAILVHSPKEPNLRTEKSEFWSKIN
jgi:hypothetical protein